MIQAYASHLLWQSRTGKEHSAPARLAANDRGQGRLIPSFSCGGSVRAPEAWGA